MRDGSQANVSGLEAPRLVEGYRLPLPPPLQILSGNLLPFVIPDAWAQSPLLTDGCFYTIPQRLLGLIFESVGPDRFDAQSVQMESELSSLVGKHSVYVGIRARAPIPYDLIEPPQTLAIRYEDVKNLNWGKTESELREFVRTENSRLQTIGEPLRGYSGWLMTNSTFLEEHDQLLREYGDFLRRHDFPKPVLLSGPGTLPQSSPDESWVGAFSRFYGRWQLQSLAGPNLPRPLPVGLPIPPAMAKNLTAAEGSAFVFLPDIVPAPSHRALAEAIESGVNHGEKATHLAEWHHIVGQHNVAKNTISRYARLMGLQHYWRTVHQRHAAALRRNAARLRAAFATYFDVSDDSIRKDIEFIGQRLGRGWEERSATGLA